MINQMGVKCFLSLSETLNFSKTARQLFISQQSVSRYIAVLEEDLDCKLFIRTKHYVEMTQAGQIYAEFFTKFKQGLREAQENVLKFQFDNKIEINLAYLDWLDISSQINYAIHKLRDNNLGLQVIAERHRQKKLNLLLEDYKVDCIITYESFAKSLNLYDFRTLCNLEYVLLSGKESPNENASYLNFVNDIYIKAQEINETKAEIRAKARQDCQRFGLSPHMIRVVPNIETAYTLAEMGEGILISTSISRMACDGKLFVYPTGVKEKLICLWNCNDNIKYVLHLIDYIQEAFKIGNI